jgi:hypothetical protein
MRTLARRCSGGMLGRRGSQNLGPGLKGESLPWVVMGVSGWID